RRPRGRRPGRRRRRPPPRWHGSAPPRSLERVAARRFGPEALAAGIAGDGRLPLPARGVLRERGGDGDATIPGRIVAGGEEIAPALQELDVHLAAPEGGIGEQPEVECLVRGD